ncbi:MAG: hypothetical protein AVDCRST_MAG38-1772, partial [uncultured Solirubrobacteraceae bacterium]
AADAQRGRDRRARRVEAEPHHRAHRRRPGRGRGHRRGGEPPPPHAQEREQQRRQV